MEYLKKQHTKRNILLKRTILILILIWIYLPVFLPDNYSGLEDEKRLVSEIAIDDADSEAPLTWWYKVKAIQEIDMLNKPLPLGVEPAEKAWKVGLVGYTYFNIPVYKIEIEVIKDSNGYHAIAGSFREYFPDVTWFIILVGISIQFIGFIILFTIPILILYYIVKKRW